MKKNLKNVSKILGVFIMLTSCASESLDLSNQDVSIVNARKWFETSKPDLKVLNYTQTVDWGNANVSNGDKGIVIEVPLILTASISAKVGDDKSFKTFNRLMFFPDEKETYKACHVLITTNDLTFYNINKDFNFYKINTNFDGYITLVNNKNEVIEHKKYVGGHISLTSKTSKMKNEAEYCVYFGAFDGNGDFTPYYLVGCYGSIGGIETGYGSSGDAGDTGDNPISSDSTLNIETFFTPNITDVKKELKCFNLSSGAKVTIYADQPISGSRRLTAEIGHTFIGITQNGVTRSVGFYPDSPYASLLSNQDSEIHDNSTSAYDVSITVDVSASQLSAIVNYITNYPSTYSLNNFNCSDFGIKVMGLGGLVLPKTVGSAPPFFEGINPADLGEDMRALKLPAGAIRNSTSGQAPAKSGTCN